MQGAFTTSQSGICLDGALVGQKTAVTRPEATKESIVRKQLVCKY